MKYWNSATKTGYTNQPRQKTAERLPNFIFRQLGSGTSFNAPDNHIPAACELQNLIPAQCSESKPLKMSQIVIAKLVDGTGWSYGQFMACPTVCCRCVNNWIPGQGEACFYQQRHA
jgi:hypothetical protein